ncbi:MAG: hypothetical protein QXT86_10855 [Archaeoglobaceae archaeon]
MKDTKELKELLLNVMTDGLGVRYWIFAYHLELRRAQRKGQFKMEEFKEEFKTIMRKVLMDNLKDWWRYVVIVEAEEIIQEMERIIENIEESDVLLEEKERIEKILDEEEIEWGKLKNSI